MTSMPLPATGPTFTGRTFPKRGPARWIAVLPLAATEQHGPHLPVGTDIMIAQAYLARVRELLADTIPATFLPLQPVGISTEHIDYPGTLTLPTEIALQSWMALGTSVARAGIKKLVMVTSHGGNSAAMSLVAQDLRAKYGTSRCQHRMGPLRRAGGIVFRRRTASRHSRRRGRDIDHAGEIPRAGAQRSDREFSAREHRDGEGLSLAGRAPAGAVRMAGSGSSRQRRCRRRRTGLRGKGPPVCSITALAHSANCSLTSINSIRRRFRRVRRTDARSINRL